MTDDLDKLEQELRQLEPRALSPATRNRILDKVQAPSAIPFPLVLLRLGAAAAIVAMAGYTAHRLLAPDEPTIEPEPIQVAAPDFVERAQMDTILINSEDEGIVLIGDNRPARRVRYNLMDRMEWTNRASGKGMNVTRPRSEIVLVGLRVD